MPVLFRAYRIGWPGRIVFLYNQVRPLTVYRLSDCKLPRAFNNTGTSHPNCYNAYWILIGSASVSHNFNSIVLKWRLKRSCHGQVVRKSCQRPRKLIDLTFLNATIAQTRMPRLKQSEHIGRYNYVGSLTFGIQNTYIKQQRKLKNTRVWNRGTFIRWC